MNTRRLFALFTVALAVMGVLSPLPALANSGSFVQVQKMSDSAARQISAKMVVDAPPSFVWQALTNYNAMQTFIPGYKKSKVVSSQGNAKYVDIEYRPAPILPGYTYQVKVQEHQPTWSLDIRRVSGDLQTLVGNYVLKPIDNGRKTLLVHQLKIDTGADLPGTTAVLKSSSEKALVALKQRSEQFHAKSYIGKN